MSPKITYNLLFAVSWALLIFSGKLAMNSGVIPLAYTLQFMALTSLLLTLYLLFTARQDLRRIRLADLPLFLAVGVLVAAAFLTGGTYGLKLTTSINYALVTKSDIVFMPLLGFLILHEKITPRTVPLMAAFILGLWLLMTSGQPVVPQLGDLLVLVGVLFFSVAAILQKILVRRLSSPVVGWVRITFGLLFLAVTIPLIEPDFLVVRSPHLIAAGAVINVCLAVLINKALSVSSAAFYGMASMTVPVFVSILGVVVFEETLGPVQLLGAVIILVSGFLASLWKV